LLLRREVLDALGEPTEIARPLACPSFGWARGTITLEPFERQDHENTLVGSIDCLAAASILNGR
jgi:hypothetical protein